MQKIYKTIRYHRWWEGVMGVFLKQYKSGHLVDFVPLEKSSDDADDEC